MRRQWATRAAWASGESGAWRARGGDGMTDGSGGTRDRRGAGALASATMEVVLCDPIPVRGHDYNVPWQT